MRVGIFDPYLDDLGGGEKYMMTIAECLSKNHDVYIFWDNKKDISELSYRFPLDLSKVKIIKNIFAPGFSFIKRIIESKEYDVIIVLSDGSIPFVLSKKLFIHIQQPMKYMQTDSVIDKLKLARVNKFFCNSQYTKSFIDKKFGLKTIVLYPPVALYPKNIKKENIILHVGRFRVKNVNRQDYKKQGIMIATSKQMVNEGLRDWKFILAVGVQEKDRKIFEAMKRQSEGFPIEFLINKSNDKLWDIYSKAKIYWHASGFGEDLEEHPEYAEHFGISTVEAMGAGAVPVVINSGGQKEIVTDEKNGFLWDSLDELRKKTTDLINNELLLNKLSREAVESARKFSKEKFYREINSLVLS